MAFDNLTNKISKAFKNITGKGKLSERNMDDMLQEIRLALLDADVNYQVVTEFLNNVKKESIGREVYTSVNPDQMVVKIVHDELVKLLGEKEATVEYKMNGMTVIMFVGLQGTGKTTNLAKMAKQAKEKQGRNPMIIAGDVIRPAAIEQLKTLGEQIGVYVYSQGITVNAYTTVREGMDYARRHNYDTVFIDTAGRLHIDEDLMKELKDIKKAVKPDEILLTVDAMTGQDIINVAQSFNDQVGVTGLVVTKFDGDARGGGVVSVRAVTGVPVKFVGTGEKMDDFELFYPERVAERILGMGDIVSLVEKAEEKFDMEAQEKAAERMLSGQFDLNDMAYQLRQVNKLGSLKSIMGMIPGMNQFSSQIDEDKANSEMKINLAIIDSMTKEERANPSIIRASRQSRIAEGSGTSVAQVRKLLQTYEKSKKQMGILSKLAKGGGFKF